jgi:DNA end-binding protein Ku
MAALRASVERARAARGEDADDGTTPISAAKSARKADTDEKPAAKKTTPRKAPAKKATPAKKTTTAEKKAAPAKKTTSRARKSA